MNTQWVKNIFKAVMSRGMAAEMDEEEKRDEGKLADNSFQRVDSALKWKCSYKVSQLITRKGVVVVHFREKKKEMKQNTINETKSWKMLWGTTRPWEASGSLLRRKGREYLETMWDELITEEGADGQLQSPRRAGRGENSESRWRTEPKGQTDLDIMKF